MPVKTHLVRRGLAATLDYCLIGAMFWAGRGMLDQPEYGCLGCVIMLIALVAWFVYFVFIESTFGRTAGKALFDLVVERLDQKPLTGLDCLLRHILDPVDFLFIGGPAILAVKLSSRGQRLGDMLADTHVVFIP
ncbi:MAG TPA: RDD family protein [Thermoanaerobaculia bacterium]|nr:RDD family protein [Thermoanaerobaculia bacterium]